MWTPGYWAFSTGGYYWVPGTWVAPPVVGVLWTPGYWGFVGGVYLWNAGYWGPHVGFYGGVNYGFGYGGVGFGGGVWVGGHFAYNTAVVRVNTTVIHNTYVNKTVINNVTVNRVSYNGGRAASRRRPTPAERTAMSEPHTAADACADPACARGLAQPAALGQGQRRASGHCRDRASCRVQRSGSGGRARGAAAQGPTRRRTRRPSMRRIRPSPCTRRPRRPGVRYQCGPHAAAEAAHPRPPKPAAKAAPKPAPKPKPEKNEKP